MEKSEFDAIQIETREVNKLLRSKQGKWSRKCENNFTTEKYRTKERCSANYQNYMNLL